MAVTVTKSIRDDIPGFLSKVKPTQTDTVYMVYDGGDDYPSARKPPMIDPSKYPMEMVQALMDERGIDEKSARKILYNRDYRELNKDKLKQKRRYYYHEIVKKSPYMLKHLKEYNKKYYEEHKEKYKARTRQWIKDHPGSVSCEMKKEYNHTYYMRKIQEKRRIKNEVMAQRLNTSSAESSTN